MNLLSLSSAFPSLSFTQSECLEAIQGAPFWEELNERSRWVVKKVLAGDGGIEKRHFAIQDLPTAMTKNAEEMNNAYEAEAPKLAARAVAKALEKVGLKPEEVDALFLCSCTGYLCPGATSYVAEELSLREDTFLQDMTGLGCGAAVPLMRAASGVVAQNPEAVVVTVAVEVCSAAFYVENDFGVMISNCIFGDGAAAAVWSGKGGEWEIGDFQSIHVPEEREKIRFTNANGKLRNQLHRSVPTLAGETVKRLYEKRNMSYGQPQEFITHGGGRDVIEALEKVLPDLPDNQLRFAREVMRDYGNMSSPSVLVALEKFLDTDEASEKDHLWMCAFGAGFSAHSCELRRVH